MEYVLAIQFLIVLTAQLVKLVQNAQEVKY